MSFLKNVADRLIQNFEQDLHHCTIVFPNRRAGFFLKKELSKTIEKPIWSPRILSLEDFLLQYSDIQKSDQLTLLFKLYDAFNSEQNSKESFDNFFYWGEMLLRDFEEVDHYLVNPSQLFKFVSDDKQLAEDFYFLDKDQERIIQSFWQEFLPISSKSQEQFVETWKVLEPIYNSFKSNLINSEIGYTSHIYRSIYTSITEQSNHLKFEGHLVFAGFNALTKVEEQLIKYFTREHFAQIIWDLDGYYLNNENQEAGQFLRNYKNDKILGPTFDEVVSTTIETSEKEVNVVGVTREVGQAKLVGQSIKKLIKSGTAKQEDIVVVLPEENMLFPLLNSLPLEVTKFNVTMGYPLKESPLYGLLESALELQEGLQVSQEQLVSFYYKPVLDILSHPYLFNEGQDDLVGIIKKRNQIRVLQSDILTVKNPVVKSIFKEIKGHEYINYLLGIIEVLGLEVRDRFGLEQEFIYRFRLIISKLSEQISIYSAEIDLKTFKKLFGKITTSTKIPFSGEPVEGLQVMGVLETRNLDFKHVFMVNMNEDIFPAPQRNGSFIPFRIRKAFELPTFETQDAIYAYLFYRLFHQSKQLNFYYNLFADFGLSGEISRFIRQIELESDLKIRHYKLNNSLQVRDQHEISIQKSRHIIDKLKMYSASGDKKLSASALNTYLDCRLRFYFRYVLRLFAEDELTDQLSAKDFGNILHHVMELLYSNAITQKSNRIIEKQDFELLLKPSVNGAMEKAFKKHFNINDKQRFVAKNRDLIMFELMKKFVDATLKLDLAYAPFEIVSLENDKFGKYDKLLRINTSEGDLDINLKGIIDRVDRKKGGVRIIDYKTGRDSSEIDQMLTCFDRSSDRRNKAGFQTLYYAWLYASKNGMKEKITPAIINIQGLFTTDFDERLKINKEPLEDARPYLSEFEDRFKVLLEEVFNLDVPFNQTEDSKKCTYCDFKGICNR